MEECISCGFKLFGVSSPGQMFMMQIIFFQEGTKLSFRFNLSWLVNQGNTIVMTELVVDGHVVHIVVVISCMVWWGVN